MIPEIAVMSGDDGITTTLSGPGDVVVYARGQASWEPVRRLPFSPDPAGGISGVRRKMAELILFLGRMPGIRGPGCQRGDILRAGEGWVQCLGDRRKTGEIH